MQEIEYQVMLIRSDIENTKNLVEGLLPSLTEASISYMAELSSKTKKEMEFYDVKKAYIDDGPFTVCVAFDKQLNVLGFVFLDFEGFTKTLWICHVFVKPEFRKKGVYKLMMKRIKSFAQSIKASRIFAIVHKSNDESQKAHKKLGFSKQWTGYEMEINNEE